ncbi:phosphocarrier protein HPr [Selenihalanaerobacter shriftii]|uniref:Phosphocarrier protein HPr n=1 Tax=Selenihalanaerobacter shriftii TaxID=142842 RepID=A0A1T4PS88_9FIRM|nr:phosphocarrier protein HPr [Selenihalanaerobacter shriftii]SJZ94413.1 phosphocarrier protein [Selenihalanaerobacter shriftii]
MLEKQITVKNETGIHARPASLLVQTANEFNADIKLVKDGQEVNAKSIMGVMSLGVNSNTQITIKADGDDSKEAVDAIIDLIENNFNEE